jgi:hypothetical protein
MKRRDSTVDNTVVLLGIAGIAKPRDPADDDL